MTKDNKQTVENLQKIEAAFVRLRRILGRVDVNYTVQVSIASTDPRTVRYAAQMTAAADGLAPITFIGNDADDLVTQIKAACKNIDRKAIEIAYHKAQIKSCERTIASHQAYIEELENEVDDVKKEEKQIDTEQKQDEK